MREAGAPVDSLQGPRDASYRFPLSSCRSSIREPCCAVRSQKQSPYTSHRGTERTPGRLLDVVAAHAPALGRKDQRMAILQPAPLRWTPRLTAPGALLGILLLVGGAFAPWVVRVYSSRCAGCPAGPGCPPPDVIAPSYWDYWISVIFGARPLTVDWVLINFLFGLAPFLALLIAQAALAWLAWRAWRGGCQRRCASGVSWSARWRCSASCGGVISCIASSIVAR